MRGSWLFILLLLFSCRKKDAFENIAVIGHGGMGLEMQNSIYHDNSAEALELALSIDGCNGVELDVQLSADGKLWLYHDPELSSETNGSGCVNSKSSAELNPYHYTTIHKEVLIRLEEFDFHLFKGKKVFLDIRHYNPCTDAFVSQTLITNAILNSGISSVEGIELFIILSRHQWISAFKQAGFQVLFCTSGST
ncbi:MAG: glycerophosphodiester phosphodiesterase, partial [Bacteroidota bacterium]